MSEEESVKHEKNLRFFARQNPTGPERFMQGVLEEMKEFKALSNEQATHRYLAIITIEHEAKRVNPEFHKELMRKKDMHLSVYEGARRTSSDKR